MQVVFVSCVIINELQLIICVYRNKHYAMHSPLFLSALQRYGAKISAPLAIAGEYSEFHELLV